jgi:hypothetical protein
MTKTFCDKCQKECEKEPLRGIITLPTKQFYSGYKGINISTNIDGDGFEIDMHFCHACQRDALDVKRPTFYSYDFTEMIKEFQKVEDLASKLTDYVNKRIIERR